jgi:hypothetical protein
VGLFAGGLYRWDWVHFGASVAGRIAAGSGLGLLAAAGLQRLLTPGLPWAGVVLVLAWMTVTVGLCATRATVRTIDSWLHKVGGARG